MAFPTGATTITVTGSFPIPAGGDPQDGSVVFTPSTVLVDATHKAIYSGSGPATLDANGAFSKVLLCTDVADVQPTGWRWRVDEQISGSRRTYFIDLPSTLGATVDLSTLSPVSGPGGSGKSLPPTGPAGGDLGGAYPNPSVVRLNGVAVTGTPSSGDALVALDAESAAWSAVAAPDASPWRFDITKYGAVSDARIVTDGAVSVGSNVLTCATSQPFHDGVQGMPVLVQGAGTFGVTAWNATISGYNGPDSVTLSATPPTSISGAIVVFGTNNYAAIRAATDAAEAYLTAGHPHAEVFTPPTGGYVVDGPLDTSKSGNGQVAFGVYPTTAGKKSVAFRGGAPGAGVRHWEQLVPQISGSTWISFGFYSSTSAQTADLNANGNPGVISGPNEGTGNGLAYGAAARFSNVMPVIEDMAILTAHTAYGITYGGWNFFGCANAVARNASVSTLGTVPSSTDYTSPGTFGTGLSIAALMPAPGNNDLSIVDNVSIQGGYTYGLFFSEHTLVGRIMVLYCWAALCPVGSYAGSVGATHSMRVLSASVEACGREVYFIGVGSQGIGPLVDVQISTESSTPTVDGNSLGGLMGAAGPIRLTGLFDPAGVSVAHPSGVELINGQVPRAISRKTASFTAGPLDRALLCDTTTGSITATLPDADVNAVEYVLRNTGTNPLTVAATGGQTIYTASTAASTATVAAGSTLRVQAMYDGSAWSWYSV